MADMKTLSRLYPPEPKVAKDAKPVEGLEGARPTEEQARTVVATPPVERVRGRFRVAREEPETAYRLNAAEVMAVMAEAAPVDQSARFAELAMRERARQVFQRRFARGMRGSRF